MINHLKLSIGQCYLISKSKFIIFLSVLYFIIGDECLYLINSVGSGLCCEGIKNQVDLCKNNFKEYVLQW